MTLCSIGRNIPPVIQEVKVEFKSYPKRRLEANFNYFFNWIQNNSSLAYLSRLIGFIVFAIKMFAKCGIVKKDSGSTAGQANLQGVHNQE